MSPDSTTCTGFIFSLSAGEPLQSLLNLGENDLFAFGYSTDGIPFPITRGNWQHYIVLISDFAR